MNQEIPWSRFAVEAIVIVCSILLAFAIDAGWQARNERVEELRTLQSLLIEFEANRTIIDSGIVAHDEQADFSEQVSSMSIGTSPVPENYIEVINGAFISYRSTNYEGGTLSSILSSGGLSSIENPELRRRIAAWPSILEEATEEEQVVVRFREQILIPFAIREFPAITADIQQLLPAGVTVGEGLSQFQSLLGNDELEAVMMLSTGLRRASRDSLSIAKNNLEELIVLIETELNR